MLHSIKILKHQSTFRFIYHLTSFNIAVEQAKHGKKARQPRHCIVLGVLYGVQQKGLKFVKGSLHSSKVGRLLCLGRKCTERRSEWNPNAPLSSCRARSVFKEHLVLDNVSIVLVFVSVKIGSQPKYPLEKSVALTSCKLVQVYGAKPFIIVATALGPFHESPRAVKI